MRLGRNQNVISVETAQYLEPRVEDIIRLAAE
jgi:hypothetical protein